MLGGSESTWQKAEHAHAAGASAHLFVLMFICLRIIAVNSCAHVHSGAALRCVALRCGGNDKWDALAYAVSVFYVVELVWFSADPHKI